MVDRQRKRPLPARPAAGTAFINMPYSADYEERLLALIAGLSLYGLVPTAATVAGDDPNRLDRIVEALSDCTISIHDLTWMAVDSNEPKVPRFNMPFELGIAVALAATVGNDYVVIDTVPNRLDKALSDARGLDAEIFDGTPLGVFRALANIFHRDDFQPQPRHFRRVFGRLNTTAARLRKAFGFKSMFEAKPFSELRLLAGRISNEIRLKSPEAVAAVASSRKT
jgi:hypothetical protein